MSTVTVRLSGFKELQEELNKLSKGMARGALTRAGVAAMQPMAEIARSLAPEETGELKASIAVSAKAKGAGASVGKAEYAAAMRSGAGKAAAVAAMRDARRAVHGKGGPPSVELFMGPVEATTKRDAIKRIVQEFGSSRQPGQPYMRPAWDQDSGAMLERLKAELWAQIKASVLRAERKAARAQLRAARAAGLVD